MNGQGENPSSSGSGSGAAAWTTITVVRKRHIAIEERVIEETVGCWLSPNAPRCRPNTTPKMQGEG
jgi:hypothetical protein